MDKPLQLGNDEGFNELPLCEPLCLAHRDQGLVHIGIQLRAYVLALETHRSSGREWVDIGPQFMPRNASETFDLKDPFGGYTVISPLGNGLWRDPDQSGESLLGVCFLGQQINWIRHTAGKYTHSLLLSTAGLLRSHAEAVQYQLMVDDAPQTRLAPAPSPADYTNFGAWLTAATDNHSMRAALARYCDVLPQNVQKWKAGAVPKNPLIRRRIAMWAQVGYDELRALIERHEEWKIANPQKKAKVTRKPRPPSRTRGRSGY